MSELPELKCQECGTPISQRVSEFSAKKFGKLLCMSCQKIQPTEEIVEITDLKPKQTFSGVKTMQSVNQRVDPRISKEYIITLQGKKFITHAGLLQLAHDEGLLGINTEILHLDTEKEIIVIKATVKMKNKDPNSEPKIFTGIGDASTKNVNSMIRNHMIRMAETRAVNRALRFATNIGMTSSEEMGGEDQT